MDFPSLPPDQQEPADCLAPPSMVNQPEGDSANRQHFPDTIYNEMAELLMEEDMAEIFIDPLALRVAEESLYEVLGKQYPPSPEKSTPFCCVRSSNSVLHSTSASTSKMPISGSSAAAPMDPHVSSTPSSSNPFINQNEFVFMFQRGVQEASKLLPNIDLEKSKCTWLPKCKGGDAGEPEAKNDHESLRDDESIMLFRRGVEEAGKFLPVIDLGNYNSALPPGSKELDGGTGKNNHDREETDAEEGGRSNKQLAVRAGEEELSEMLEKVFLFPEEEKEQQACTAAHEVQQNGQNMLLLQNKQPCGFKVGVLARKRSSTQVVDLKALLFLCAQAINDTDSKAAHQMLKEIRQYSSPFGDGTQRISHYFADGIEARLAGVGNQIYSTWYSKTPSPDAMLKSYGAFALACPFRRISLYFGNHNILGVTNGATKIHIIDFGIQLGFQWPIIVRDLLARVGGPPKLRITGLEIPLPRFWRAQKVGEMGHRMAKYFRRFNIPFEYNAIDKKWDTIQIEDLKIDKDEVIAVNCLYQFENNLLDDTVASKSPRNIVLNLIKKMNPNIFIHAINNGLFNDPFFLTRFQKAFYHYSTLFDMMDSTLPRENPGRMMFEQEIFRRDVMNIIACEGLERVVRPETYKHWHARNMKVGFRPLPLNRELMKTLKEKVISSYHKDFVIEKDDHWMLLGWKGQILQALSCWVLKEP
ncbi:scarecrow-like protein 14 [Malania oleifera]|uniref:scarecrow-like protein 14 n=1 Tax=Malania oleifera TaxID=397392 RepID=UPI0025ADAD61|nr:scarecrow-like protein 14 [Malania oleifera]